MVHAGETLQFRTDPNQMWDGAFWWDWNYEALHTNANGASAESGWQWWELNGTMAGVGALVAEIDGNRDFHLIGAGDKTLAAWNSGELRMWYLDTNQGDNNGVVTSTVTTGAAVPEPASIALFGLALAGLGLARRRKARFGRSTKKSGPAVAFFVWWKAPAVG